MGRRMGRSVLLLSTWCMAGACSAPDGLAPARLQPEAERSTSVPMLPTWTVTDLGAPSIFPFGFFSSGVSNTGTNDCASSFSATAGVLNAFIISALMRLTIAGGVPTGATTLNDVNT